MNVLRAPGRAARLLAVVVLMALAACGGGGGGGATPPPVATTPPPVQPTQPPPEPPPLSVSIATVSGTPALVGNGIQFTGNASGGTAPYVYAWSFGDGASGTGLSAEHAYVAFGSYAVTFHVTDALGKTAQSTTNVVVESATGLAIVTERTDYTVGQTVKLRASSSWRIGTESYEWDLGDGRRVSGESVEVAYASKGQFTVSLAGVFGPNARRTASATINVSYDALALTMAAPDFIYAQLSTPLTFTPALTSGEYILLQLDDGTQGWYYPGSTGYAFPKAGTYQVKATRTNPTGATATATMSVTVLPAPAPSGLTLTHAQVTTKPAEASAGVSFTVGVAADAGNYGVLYAFDFGDGKTSDPALGSWFTHTYAAAGSYTVTVTATNAYGRSTTGTATIGVGPRQALKLLAGDGVINTRIDGPALSARFREISGLVFDAAGNLYISDAGNSAVRKLTPGGTVSTIEALSGCGYYGGWGHSMIAPRDDGVLDALMLTCGGLTRLAADGTTVLKRDGFSYGTEMSVTGMARTADGRLTLGGSGVIRRFEGNGTMTYLAGSLNSSSGADGQGAAAGLGYSMRLRYGPDGLLYVSDGYRIRTVTENGTVSTLAGRLATPHATVDGQGAAADFEWIEDMAMAPDGTMIVLQSNGTLRKVTASGAVSTMPVSLAVAGDPSAIPSAVAVGPDGLIVVADSHANIVRRVNADNTLTTIAGTLPILGRVDGLRDAAAFSRPQGIAQGPSGALYVADSGNRALRKITLDGQVTTLAVFSGNSVQMYGSHPYWRGVPDLGGVAVDAQENVYVADAFMNVVRKVAPDGTQSIVAGRERTMGYADGTVAQSRLYAPLGVAVDAAGNVYVSDFNHAIRKVTPAGIVSTIAGIAGYVGSQDGIGSGATFNFPSHLVAAADGTVYVTDYGNGTVRKIAPDGRVTTVAGRLYASCQIDGPIGTNCIWEPLGLSLDHASGELYLTGQAGVFRLRTDGWLERVMASDRSRRTVAGYLPSSISSAEGVAVLSNGQLAITSENAVLVTSFER
ncbi:PKD domain-containing protein [Roseateles noduli]|uniref:PKD domain-containing protein n=1 Tax=Roseateles noduli TaxID=2052484 RepID=UPI003D65863A